MFETFHVTENEDGLSLLKVLRERLCFSNKLIKQAVLNNGCTVNKQIQRFSSYKVKRGDQITFQKQKLTEKKLTLDEVLYEDESLIAYYKPPFYVCDGICNVHRLDKETSGVILSAKREKKAFLDLFKNRDIEKTYYAIVKGRVKKESGDITSFLGVKTFYQGQKIMGNVKGGQIATTSWKKLACGEDFSLLKCSPKTGRTHQIRVHLMQIGHPILGDYQYGKNFALKADRVLLHAYSLQFIHPIKNRLIKITAPIPDDFLRFFHEDLYS